MSIHLEIGQGQLKKAGEELCGDTIEVLRTDDCTIIVLSDGLGSGVKANILSRLTAKTAATMLKMGSGIEEVIETIAHTLPVCKVRQLAYSTFTILQVFSNGWAYLAEYDNPPVFFGNNSDSKTLIRNDLIIGEKPVKEACFRLSAGDWLVLVSDGVLHAGIGGVWNLGWGWERVCSYLEKTIRKEDDATDWAEQITGLCNKLYGEKPGDDASVVVVKARLTRNLTALIGPPRNPADDPQVAQKLIKSTGLKVVCGGTTGNLISRFSGREIEVDLYSDDHRVPPMGIMPGIDLVTEGMITLVYTLEHLRNGTKTKELHMSKNGAGRLAAALLEADNIHIIVGLALNPALLSPEIPTKYALKHQVIQDILTFLEKLGKMVTAEYY